MRLLRAGIVAAMVLAGLLDWLAPAVAANWPRFRGPNGTGIALDKEIPVEWTDKEVLWKTELPGIGNSSPIVWGDRLFIQSASKDGKERSLLCVNVKDGKIVWTRSVPGSAAHTHLRNTWASSTPATDGERVCVCFWNGQSIFLHAYDFQGKELWQRDLGPFKSQHGAGHSPMLFEDKVFLANDQDGSSTLLAFDAKTGKTVWQVPRPAFRTCYSTPFILEKPDQTNELIVASTAGITAYHPHKGEEKWNWKWAFVGMALRTVASPVAGHGIIFANSGDGAGDRHTVAVRAGTSGDVSQTNLVWEEKKTFPYVPCFLNWGDHLYYVSDRGIAGCVEARTGKVVWTERLGGGVAASPILIDGRIYSVDESGNMFVFPAAPKFQLLAKNSLGEIVFATPAVADNRLYIRGKTHLFCIGKPTGK